MTSSNECFIHCYTCKIDLCRFGDSRSLSKGMQHKVWHYHDVTFRWAK